jgi:hypothetical protein
MKHQNSVSCGTANRILRDILLIFGFSAIAWAAVGGGLSGNVTDAKGAPISGARLVAVSAAQGLQTKTSSDAKGAYRFPALAVGLYDLRVEAPGYKPGLRKLAIHVDDRLRLDIMLEADAPQP